MLFGVVMCQYKDCCNDTSPLQTLPMVESDLTGVVWSGDVSIYELL